MAVLTQRRFDLDDRLARSTQGLAELAPDYSAARLLSRGQKIVAIALAVVLVVGLITATVGTLTVLVAFALFIYLATITQRLFATYRSVHAGTVMLVSDEEALAVPDDELPIYTVLVPAFREASVMPTLVANLRALDYPRQRLDVKLLLEEDDVETIAAARAALASNGVDIVLVPPGEPRTKPKALNYGLAEARGDLVTIYDAEDHPDPLQLRRAAVAFARSGDDMACFQAQLTYHNSNQNLITKFFSAEYLLWFWLFLPGLNSTDAPVPLGGTSNHMRRDVIETLGAWDPYNVTEDADLGIRLHRFGWRTGVLGSQTYEEANSDFVNWVKQRSRWYKGYLQTWLVHMRHPIVLWRQLGAGGFLQFGLFVGGTPLLALINLIFWFLALLWFVADAKFVATIFPTPVYFVGMFCLLFGNASMIYLTVIAARRLGNPRVALAACLAPLYWVMMSIAAVKAAWQLVITPSYWEKTAHGLSPTTLVIRDQPATADYELATVRSRASSVGFASALLGDPAAPGGHLRRARELRVDDRRRRLGVRVAVVGVVLLGFVAYATLVTGWQASRAQHRLKGELAGVQATATTHPGEPIARVEIDRSGVDSVAVEGVGRRELARGVGHMPASAFPGGAGTAMLVAHSHAFGRQFADLSSLQVGDTITISSPWGEAQYSVTGSKTSSSTPRASSGRTGPALLELVGAAPGSDGSRTLVVSAELSTSKLDRVPRRSGTQDELPGTDWLALLAVALWCLGAYVAGRAVGFLKVRWGAGVAIMLMTPVVAIVLYQAYGAAMRLLPATF